MFKSSRIHWNTHYFLQGPLFAFSVNDKILLYLSISMLTLICSQIYKQKKDEKKHAYNQLIIQVEKATFTPLVFSTTGGMAPECTLFHKKVAEHIAMKTKEEYLDVMNHLRTRLRFSLPKRARWLQYVGRHQLERQMSSQFITLSNKGL